MASSPEWELNFDSAPFCNGSLHLGHVRTYGLGDVRARWLRARGVRLRYTTTFDAFGIPNEIGAERAGLPADEFVNAQIARITAQLEALHFSYDGAPPQRYCDPSYYRWTQWLFLRLHEMDLVYALRQPTPYCPSCEAFLAHSQIEGGLCWRCDGRVESRQSMQWYVRSTDYSDRLYEGIDSLTDWSDRARNLVRSHLGRTNGVCFVYEIDADSAPVSLMVFSPDAENAVPESFGVRSDHPLFGALQAAGGESVQTELIRSARRRVDEGEKPKAVCLLRAGESTIPVFVVPPREVPHGMDAVVGAKIDGDKDLSLPNFSCHRKSASDVTVYRAQDWLVSRNRTWGTPLPLVECGQCGVQPVRDECLPVLLPLHGGDGRGECSRCGAAQPLVARVMDCFFDDAWCFFGTSPFKKPAENPFESWSRNPATRVHFHSGYDTYMYLHVFRFIGYVLYDLGYADRPEPIQFYQGHDLITSGTQKMAKRAGNAPELDALLRAHGPDAVRLSVLANANPAKTLSWSEDRLKQARRIVRSIEDLIALEEPGGGGADTGQVAVQQPPSRSRQLQILRGRISRVNGFIEEYRIGSAIDTVYTATRDLIRLSDSLDASLFRELRDELLLYWSFFAPETTSAGKT